MTIRHFYVSRCSTEKYSGGGKFRRIVSVCTCILDTKYILKRFFTKLGNARVKFFSSHK